MWSYLGDIGYVGSHVGDTGPLHIEIGDVGDLCGVTDIGDVG